MKKRVNIAVAFLFAAVTVTVVLIQGDGTDTAQKEKEKIILGLALQPSSSLAVIAMEKGFFAKAGLNVEARAFPSGKRAIREGLSTNSVDIAVTSDIPAVIEIMDQKDEKIVASIGWLDNTNRIVARRDRNITRPGDLEGKWIATQQASAVHYFLHLFLHKNDIEDNRTNIVFMEAEALVPALAEGKIDAFCMREPYISQAKKILGDNGVIFEAPGIYPQSDLVVATGAFIAENPLTVKKFLSALIEAERFAKTHRDEAIAIVAKRLGADKRIIDTVWESATFDVTLEQSLLLLLENEARWAIRHRLVGAKSVHDFTDHLYLGALKGVNADAVTVVE